MKHSHIRQHMLLMALPLLVLGGASAARAADDAPRGWVDSHTHRQLPVAYEHRHGPAVYGWSYRAHGYPVGPAAGTWNVCGVYHYWNGEECVDARDIAPKY
jgi:hypothetical protein